MQSNWVITNPLSIWNNHHVIVLAHTLCNFAHQGICTLHESNACTQLETIRIAFSWMHSNLNVYKSRLNAQQCTAGWVAQHPINISKWALCTISRHKRELFRNRSRTRLMQSTTTPPAYKVASKARSGFTAACCYVCAPANEFIVCALTRIKRHVYDKLKQHTMRPSARRAKRNPARAESSFFLFLSLVCPIVG